MLRTDFTPFFVLEATHRSGSARLRIFVCTRKRPTQAGAPPVLSLVLKTKLQTKLDQTRVTHL